MTALPEPDWIALSESASRAMRAFDAEPSVVEAALVAAFHDWKIRTRGRCGTYFGDDRLYDLAKSIWDRADVDWQGNEFAIPAHTPGRRIHIFSEVVVHREDLEEWINNTAAAPNLTDASRTKGGSARKYNDGLQQFIDQLQVEFEEKNTRLTLSSLEAWLEGTAPQDERYDPEPPIPDCGEIEFCDNRVYWKDQKGHPQSVALKTLERYILRAKSRASNQAT